MIDPETGREVCRICGAGWLTCECKATKTTETFRERMVDDLMWIVEQKREVQAFVQKQLERDGRIYDGIL